MPDESSPLRPFSGRSERCELEAAGGTKAGVRAGDCRTAQRATVKHPGAIADAVPLAGCGGHRTGTTWAQPVMKCSSALPIDLEAFDHSRAPFHHQARLDGVRSNSENQAIAPMGGSRNSDQRSGRLSPIPSRFVRAFS